MSMKLLDRLVLKDLLPMFAVGVAFFSVLWFMGGPVLTVGRFMSQYGVSWAVALKFLWLSVPAIVAYTLPMGMLLAALIGFGRLSSNSEAVALYAGGIPFARIAAPALVLGLLATGVTYWLNDSVAANATKALADLEATFVQHTSPSHEKYIFSLTVDDKLCEVTVYDGYDIQSQMLRKVTIVFYDATGRPETIATADRAKGVGGMHWVLINPTIVTMGAAPVIQTLPSLEANLIPPEQMGYMAQHVETLDVRQLQTKIRALKQNGGLATDIREAEVSLWSRLALPFSCLVFAAIGAPLGLQRQRSAQGSGFGGWVLSIVIVFAYYVVYMVMSSVARSGQCPAGLAVFLPNIVGLGVGGYLSWRASAF